MILISLLDKIKHRTRQRNSALNKAFLPPSNENVSEFSEKHRVLSVEDTPEHGLFRCWSFQREMMDVFNEPGVQLACYMTSSQVSKSTLLSNILMYVISRRKGGINFMLPSDSLAKEFSKARLTSMIRDCPELAKLVPRRNSSGNTVLFKQWATGFLRFVGSGNADKLCSFPTPWVFVDELDRCEVVARNSAGVVEGNSLALLFERMKRFSKKFALLTSTPSLEDVSQIWQYWLKSDQRLPYFPCPHCGFEQFLKWDSFDWIGKGDKHFIAPLEDILDSFHFRCAECSDKIRDSDFEEFPPPVRWVGQNREGRYPGFHINAFYTNSWRENFEKFLAAGQNQAKLMVWENTTLGLPFRLQALATPQWEKLFRRQHQYNRGVVPAAAKVLLAGCDVQHDRVEVTVCGVVRDQFYVVDHHVLTGNTHSKDDQVWKDLDDLLYQSTWPSESGGSLMIYKMAIDSRHNTNAVGWFARTRKKVIPVTGTGVWSDKVLPAKKFEIKVNGQIHRIGKRRFPLGVNLLKMDLYGRLNLETSAEDLPSDYISFPAGFSEEYYRQLTGEACEICEDSEGRTKYRWIKKHPDVETLDCMVYILGLHSILNMLKWSDQKWEWPPPPEKRALSQSVAKASGFL